MPLTRPAKTLHVQIQNFVCNSCTTLMLQEPRARIVRSSHAERVCLNPRCESLDHCACQNAERGAPRELGMSGAGSVSVLFGLLEPAMLRLLQTP